MHSVNRSCSTAMSIWGTDLPWTFMLVSFLAVLLQYYEEIGKPTPKVEVMQYLKAKQYVDAKDFAGECEAVVVVAKGQGRCHACPTIPQIIPVQLVSSYSSGTFFQFSQFHFASCYLNIAMDGKLQMCRGRASTARGWTTSWRRPTPPTSSCLDPTRSSPPKGHRIITSFGSTSPYLRSENLMPRPPRRGNAE